MDSLPPSKTIVDLPDLVLHKIAMKLEVKDVISMANMNSSMKEKIKRLGLRCAGYSLNWNAPVVILSHRISTDRYYFYIRIPHISEKVASVFRLYDHLTQYYKGPTISLELEMHDLPFLAEHGLYEKMKECDRITITSCFPTGNTLSTLLDRVSVHRTMRLVLPEEQPVDHPTIFNIANLEVNYGKWMTRAHLLQLENQKIQLDICRLDETDMNSFIKNWLDKENDRLEFLIIGIIPWEKTIDPGLVFKGITYSKWDPEIRDRMFFPSAEEPDMETRFQREIQENGYDLEEAFDVHRKDGKIGSIMITDDKMQLFVFDKKAT